MSEFLPLLALFGGSVAASIGTALLGSWIGSKEMESYAKEMVKVYINMMIPLMFIQMLGMIMYLPFQMLMYVRW